MGKKRPILALRNYAMAPNRFSAGPTDERYVTGRGVRVGVTLCDRGGGQNWPKKALRNS